MIRHTLRILAPALALALMSAVATAQTAPAAGSKSAKAAKSKQKAAATPADASAKAAAATAPAEAAPAAEKDKPATPPPAGSSPMAELKKSNAALEKVLQRDRPNWSPEAEAQRSDVRKIVGSFLDFQELGRRALARHWETITPKQRQEFVSTLRDLVERSYLRQVHGKANYKMAFEKEEKNGSEASVFATLHTTSKGKKVKIAIEYKTMYKEGHWVVYDVLTDEQSMLENYRAEFNKIITRESFDALLKKMKKKLEEKEE